MRVIDLLWDHAFRYRILATEQLPIGAHSQEHEQLIEYIAQGELEPAIELLHVHIQSSVDALARTFTESTARPEKERAPFSFASK
jgi:DNA-binding GntR family transcriptional regulator